MSLALNVGETYTLAFLLSGSTGAELRLKERWKKLSPAVAYKFLVSHDLLARLERVESSHQFPRLVFKKLASGDILTLPLSGYADGRLVRGDSLEPISGFTLIADETHCPKGSIPPGSPFFFEGQSEPSGYAYSWSLMSDGRVAVSVALLEKLAFSYVVRQIGLDFEIYRPSGVFQDHFQIFPSELQDWWSYFTPCPWDV